VHGDRVYIRDAGGKPPVMLATVDGSDLGEFSSLTAPAFDGNLGFYVRHSGQGLALTAVDLTTGLVQWSQIGDGSLSSAPLVVNGNVIIGSFSGMVDVYDETTGAHLWSANAGAGIQFPDEYNAQMLVGLAAADGMLFVPASTTLVAYRSAPTPTATSTAMPTSTPRPVGGVALDAPTQSGDTFDARWLIAIAGAAIGTFGAALYARRRFVR